MAKNTDTAAATVIGWLGVQLGARTLAPLTTTDNAALRAAVEILNLWNYCDEAHEDALLAAFAACVMAMQPQTREFAYHAIAHVGEWSTRRTVWTRAGLGSITPTLTCRFE